MNSSLRRTRSEIKRKGRCLINEISRRNWECVSDLLVELSELGRIDYKCPNCHTDHTLFHYLLEFSPPLRVVRKFFQYIPDAVFEIDCMDRYPLHIALLSGAHFSVVKFLIRKNPQALTEFDKEGKSAVHLALDGFELIKLDSVNELIAIDSLLEVIDYIHSKEPSLFCKTSPSRISVTDYAIEKKVDFAVFRHLKRLRTKPYSNDSELDKSCSSQSLSQSSKTAKKFFTSFIPSKKKEISIIKSSSDKTLETVFFDNHDE